MISKNLTKLIFVVYFAIVSTLILPMLHIPIILLNFPVLLFNDVTFFVEQIIFLVVIGGIPIIALFLFYKLIDKSKNKYSFFLITFLIMASLSYFNYTIQFILTDNINAKKLLMIGIIFVLYSCFNLTYFWREIINKKNMNLTKRLYFPLILTLLVLLIDWMYPTISGDSLILRIYIIVGEFILKYSNINIFYIDYYGFVGVFLSLIASLSAALFSLDLSKYRYLKK